MDEIRTLLETQPLFSLFLTVALGFLVGEINIKGFSLGSGAVIFVGLAIGGFAPKAAPPALLGTLGLLLFLYGVGVQYGGQFFRGLTSPEGLKANPAAAIGVDKRRLPVPGAHSSCRHSDRPDARPFCRVRDQQRHAAGGHCRTQDRRRCYRLQRCLSLRRCPADPLHSSAEHMAQAEDRTACWRSRSILQRSRCATRILLGCAFPSSLPNCRPVSPSPRCAETIAIELPSDSFVLNQDDVLLATSTDKAALQQAVSLLGELQPGSIAHDRQDMDYIRVFVSKRTVVGRAIGDLEFPADAACSIVQVRRGDSDMMPTTGSDPGSRRPCRRIRASLQDQGCSRLLRRLDKGDHGLQLYFDGHRRRARTACRHDTAADSRGRQDHPRPCRPPSFRPVSRKGQADTGPWSGPCPCRPTSYCGTSG